jgi:heme O synthase-like polyprenyltransferase
MGKKLALNVLYNICIFVCLALIYYGFEHTRYEFIAGAVFIGVVFVILKIRLLKEVRNMQKKP